MNNIKNIFGNGVIIGSLSGFIIGMCINNNIILEIKNQEKEIKNYVIPKLIVTTGVGVMIPPILFILSPLVIFNYLSNSSVNDKLFDKFKEHVEKNYVITYERVHQYDGNNDKYAFPSAIKISIEKIG